MYAEKGLQLDGALLREIEDAAEAGGISPVELIREAVAEYVATHGGNGMNAQEPLGEWLLEAADAARAAVPAEEWAKLPKDLAQNFDHYHYGHPRE